MRNVVMLVAVTCWTMSACSKDDPPATGGQYCATISANLAQLNAPAIVDAAGIEATAELYRSITSIAPLAVQEEWALLASNIETAGTVDPNDATSLQSVADMARSSQHAATAISDYTSKVCGVAIGTPPTTVPAVPTTDAP